MQCKGIDQTFKNTAETDNIARLLDRLNEEQRAAVTYCTGPELVVAGAGSGKTRVLTYKIAYLLEMKLPPYYILALTFTNKAANEMKERVGELVDKTLARQLWMGTFHSIFAKILRKEGKVLGYTSDYTIYDATDSQNMIKTIIKEEQLDEKVYRPKFIQNKISLAKNNLLTPSLYANTKELCSYDNSLGIPKFINIFYNYQERLKAGNSMDFDDLLLQTNILLRDYPEVLDKYRNRFQYILVDEYQDTNFAQHRIILQLASAHHRVCVVGDDAQSIYSFRGANIENILTFKDHFPETITFKLERNYRSTQNIVNAANSLISKNKAQIKKNIYSKNEPGDKVEIRSTFSDFEEGLVVANTISTMRLETHDTFNDFAILYRKNAQSRIFESALRKNNIPYRIYGGLSFYSRKEIKDVISYMRFIINPSDEQAFRRIINYPKRGIGDATVAKIAQAARSHNVPLWDVLSDPSAYDMTIGRGTAEKLSNFQILMQDLIDKNRTLNAAEITEQIIHNTGIWADIYGEVTTEGTNRQQNIQELANAVNEFVDMCHEEGREEVNLSDFLAEISLLTDQDSDDDSEERVSMMTVHSAKGLEFKHVFVVGMEEDLFPSPISLDFKSLEEERRLFYVAITRAKKTCIITYAKNRMRNGITQSTKQSRFLSELDQKYVNSNERDNGGGFWDNFDRHTAAYNNYDGQRQVAWQQTHPDFSQNLLLQSQRDNAQKQPFKQDCTSYVSNSSIKDEQQQHRNDFIKMTSDSQFSKTNTTSPTSSIKAEHPSKPAKLSQAAENLRSGDIIEHERFGIGIVTEILMDYDDRRAFVDFDSVGRKQLLLKFAKFKIVGHKKMQ